MTDEWKGMEHWLNDTDRRNRSIWRETSPSVTSSTTKSYMDWPRIETRHFLLLTLSWPAGHTCPTYKESFQVRWGNTIPLFLHAAIYLEVPVFRWTSQNAFSSETAVYKWYCVQCCITALHTVSFVHGCFAGNAFWLVQWNRDTSR